MRSKKFTFEDIGGHQEIKGELIYLAKMITDPKRKEYGYMPPKFLIFYGIPGTGKTLTAEAFANECGLEFNHLG